MPATRIYSQYARTAVSLLGKMIAFHRKTRKLTAQDLASRAGISRTTLQKIEKGDMGCEIGIVFEVAALAGVQLFEADGPALRAMVERFDDKISLLPQRIRVPQKEVDDAF